MLKFKVNNLGRVINAEVELAPLLILVGKNNTGKSYLASLIWALGELQMLDEFRGGPRRPSWFTSFVAPFDKPGTRRLVVDEEKADKVLLSIRRALDRKTASFLSAVFAYDGFKDTKIKIIDTDFQPFTVELDVAEEIDSNEKGNATARLSYIQGDSSVNIFAIPVQFLNNGRSWITDIIFNQIVGYVLFGKSWPSYQRQIYIPAARTGIMLALPALVSQALSPTDESERTPLPRPMLDFLRHMARQHVSVNPNRTESLLRERIKQRLVHGRITSRKNAASEFQYIPDGTDISLPLHATSSMITELAPFMVTLDRNVSNQHIIFEEPEAHLHLEAQREMARLIARLVNSGTRVTLTTHSDTFVQQINNLMSLHEHPQRDDKIAALGYEQADLVDPKATKAYEFCEEVGGTEVRPIERTSEGFAVSTLNDTLFSLAKETISLRSQNDA